MAALMKAVSPPLRSRDLDAHGQKDAAGDDAALQSSGRGRNELVEHIHGGQGGGREREKRTL
jgi:hypothetical protein